MNNNVQQLCRGDCLKRKSTYMPVIVSTGLRCSPCGYCKCNGNTSMAEGFICNDMSADEYQWFGDNRWRRCGCYFYKPYLQRTCCRLQSIRY